VQPEQSDRCASEMPPPELADRGILVLSDETYLHFVYEGRHWSVASIANWRRNVVVIGTFSKSFAIMGWRVGFMLADAARCACRPRKSRTR
jgi:aspartate/methionine/tyrosine aminotransferase